MAPAIANAAFYCTDSRFSQKGAHYEVGHKIPYALCMFNALIILRTSSSLKYIELNLDFVKNI